MKLKKSELREVLKNQLLFDTPRKVGNPQQWNVLNWSQYLDFIRSHTGRAICFTSHNHYPQLDQLGDPIIVEVSKLFTDLDSKEKPENALLDANKMYDWCEELGLGCWVNFSGSKGFHHYTELKPKKYMLDAILDDKLRAVHNYLAHEIKIRTQDIKCRDPKRLCRIPMSRYATMERKKGKKNAPIQYIVGETYCSPLKPEYLSWQVLDIIEYAKNPEPIVVKRIEPKITMDKLISKLGINVKDWALRNETEDERTDEGQVVAPLNKTPPGAFIKTVKAQIGRECIYNDLFSPNPTHTSRRIAVTILKRQGLTFREVIDWFDKIAHLCGWVDRAFRDVRLYQIKHIYYRYPPYHPDGCGKLRFVHKLCPHEGWRETKYPFGKCKPIEELVK